MSKYGLSEISLKNISYAQGKRRLCNNDADTQLFDQHQLEYCILFQGS